MSINFRKAKRADLHEIIRLLSEDDIGATREKYNEDILQAYIDAFTAITADKNSNLIVAEANHKIIGTMQLTYITYLTYQGGKRAQIESVRVDKSYRSNGIGKLMLQWAIQQAKLNGCHLVQLTTNKARPRAIHFYKKLGFVDSHEGMKLFI